MHYFINYNKPIYYFLAALALAALTALLLTNYIQEDEVESGVYRIITKKPNAESFGTGFKVAEPNVVITNHHVIQGGREIHLRYRDDGKVRDIPMRVIWHDREQDLAILRSRLIEGEEPIIPGKSLTLAQISVEDLHKKDTVEAIGYPGAADDLAKISSNFKMSSYNHDNVITDATVTTGTVQRQIPGTTRLTIQHSANVNSGNSGGPLLDSCQRVVGVNTLSQTAELNLKNLASALNKSGVIRFQTPGALEASVHVQEVLSALRDERIDANVSYGRCRSGILLSEIAVVGFTSTLSLALFCTAGFSALRNGSTSGTLSSQGDPGARSGWQSAVAVMPGHTVAVTPLLQTTHTSGNLALVETLTGHMHSLSTLETKLQHGGVILGRAGSEADICLESLTMSRRHACVRRHNSGDLVIQDLGSTNGTTVDGTALVPRQDMVLSNGSLLILGELELTVCMSSERGDQATLWNLSGFTETGKVFQHQIEVPVKAASNEDCVEIARVGRASGNHIILHHASVSREHAVIVMNSQNRLCVIDLNSSNGTSVDGSRVGPSPEPIEGARELRFGEVITALSRLG
ncbi:FHA domain-containing protein [Roseibium sp.]|uniref:FHA domain-containing protein n=1 Tax=Roseibium sp. TaxID=1936156 RepID=UPI003A9820C9